MIAWTEYSWVIPTNEHTHETISREESMNGQQRKILLSTCHC